MVLPTSSPAGGAFRRDLLDQKSKSLLFPGAGGPWLQMTIALPKSTLYCSISLKLSRFGNVKL